MKAKMISGVSAATKSCGRYWPKNVSSISTPSTRASEHLAGARRGRRGRARARALVVELAGRACARAAVSCAVACARAPAGRAACGDRGRGRGSGRAAARGPRRPADRLAREPAERLARRARSPPPPPRSPMRTAAGVQCAARAPAVSAPRASGAVAALGLPECAGPRCGASVRGPPPSTRSPRADGAGACGDRGVQALRSVSDASPGGSRRGAPGVLLQSFSPLGEHASSGSRGGEMASLILHAHSDGPPGAARGGCAAAPSRATGDSVVEHHPAPSGGGDSLGHACAAARDKAAQFPVPSRARRGAGGVISGSAPRSPRRGSPHLCRRARRG